MHAEGSDGRALRLILPILALGVLAASPAAARVPHGFTGVAVTGPMFHTDVDVEAEFALMARSGVGSVVAEFNWAVEQPTEGEAPDFSRTDRIVLAAARRRMTVLPVVVFAPAWAAEDPASAASPPRPAPYAAYLKAAIARYGPRGTLWAEYGEVPRVPIRDWQVWNEPSHTGFWSVQPSTRPYVRLLRVAARAIRGADRGARVVLAGLVYKSWQQLDALYAAGARGLFDVLSLHPYTRRLHDVVVIMRRNRRVLDAHGDRRVPIMATEVSWPSARGRTDSDYGYEVTEAQQARMVARALPVLAAQRRRLRLERFYWFTWLSEDADPHYPFDYAGLRRLTPDGPRDKPARAAFARAARALRR